MARWIPWTLSVGAMAAALAVASGGSLGSVFAQTPPVPLVEPTEGPARSVARDYSSFNFPLLLASGWLQDPRFAQAVQQLNAGALRIPGGTVAQYWDWKRGGIKRAPYRGLPNTSRYKGQQLDVEGMNIAAVSDFMRRSDRDAIFVASVMTGTLEENLATLDELKRQGINTARIEIGNEEYFRTGDGRARFPRSDDYATLAADWSRAIKARYPGVQTAAIAPYPWEGTRLDYRDWTGALTRQGVWNTADALAIHPYFRPSPANAGPAPLRSDAGATNAIVQMLAFDDATFRTMSATVPAHVRIWVTEWNVVETEREAVFGGTWIQALSTLARSLNALDHRQVDLVTHHSLLGPTQWQAIVGGNGKAMGFNRQGKARRVAAQPFALSGSGRALALLGEATAEGGQVTKLGLGVNEAQSPVMAYRVRQPDGDSYVVAVNATARLFGLDLRGDATILSAPAWDPVHADNQLKTESLEIGRGGLIMPAFSAVLLRES